MTMNRKSILILILLIIAMSIQAQDNETPSSTLNPVIENLVNNMVYVEGGTFMMGATSEQYGYAYDREKPVHQVTLSSFRIGRYEVTQEEWEAVMGDNRSLYKGAKRPVERVSWDDCQEFIRRLNDMTGLQFRLPTEAEWEYAARGGQNSGGFRYAGSNDLGFVAWHSGNSGDRTHVVGQKCPNELGLYDMSGNVWEWCQDLYGDYASSAQMNPKGALSGTKRVLRGGTYCFFSSSCRVTDRSQSTSDMSSETIGFRLAQ